MRNLRILSVVAIVAMLSTMVTSGIPLPPPVPWSGVATGQIPVVMDIAPAVSIEIPTGCQIKLMPGDVSEEVEEVETDSVIYWLGVANPQPILHSNVRVSLTGTLDVVNPVIQADATQWGIALQGQPWTTGNALNNPLGGINTFVVTTPSIYLDVAYIGAGRAIPIAVYVQNPDLTARPPELNSRVATVTLTATPY